MCIGYTHKIYTFERVHVYFGNNLGGSEFCVNSAPHCAKLHLIYFSRLAIYVSFVFHTGRTTFERDAFRGQISAEKNNIIDENYDH